MKPMKLYCAALLFSYALIIPAKAQAFDSKGSGDILFNVSERKSALQQPHFSRAKAACAAPNITLPDMASITPIDALRATEAYGADNRASGFSWAVMVLGGRALGGDNASAEQLKTLLLRFARADAFANTVQHYDPYYALKRIMFPVIVNYAVIQSTLTEAERATVTAWIDRIVAPLDVRFGKIIDENNHRILGDATLMAWGILRSKNAMVEQGKERFTHSIDAMDAQGFLPLEMRRGARAMWYMRQTSASLSAMAVMDAIQAGGEGLWGYGSETGNSLARLISATLHGSNTPLFALRHASANESPGPSSEYFTQDLGYLHPRGNSGNSRHYFAFSEAVIAHQPEHFVSAWMQKWMAQAKTKTATAAPTTAAHTAAFPRPMIDEFIGGNASCFFMRGNDAL